MVAKILRNRIRNIGWGARGSESKAARLFMAFLLVPILGWFGVDLQAQESSQSPAAASGMTTGLPGVSQQRQAELMHIRARAQAAKPEAERAAMERSAEDALARSSDQQILDDARETKRLKEEASRQIQYQKAANAYQGVSASELNSWADETGRVKVERGVPPEVLAALPPELEDSEEAQEEKTGFSPFKMPKKAAQGAARAAGGAAGAAMGAAKKGLSWIPGVGKDDEETGITAKPRNQEAAPSYSAADEVESGGGMFSRLRNRGGDAAEPAATQQAAQTYEPEEEKKGFFRGVASSIPFVGRNDADGAAISDSGYVPDSSGSGPAFVGPSGSVPAPAMAPVASSGEFDSGSTSVGASSAMPSTDSDNGGGGFFKNIIGRGSKDKSDGLASGSGNIDASLFPQEGDPDEMMADTSSGRKRFFKMPKLEIPELALPSSQESPAPDTPMPKKDRSPVHSGGSALYVVQTNGAQFMRFAGGPLGSEAQTLSAGTQVKMTKVGDEWSSVQLSNGSTGIVRNKDLKPSSGSDGGANFATQMPATGGLATSSTSGSARITSPVSATGAGISDVPGPPVSLPTSTLTGGGLLPSPNTSASQTAVE